MDDNIIEKLAILTTIEPKVLQKLVKKAELCMCDSVFNAWVDHNYQCYLDLGVGQVGIDYSSGDTIKYNFVPSKTLEKMLVKMLSDEVNPLTIKVEQSLVNKITNTYKDLL